MVTKFVMITSSFGIIIRARNSVKTRFLPRNESLANAKAASVVTKSISAVVTAVKSRVFSRYLPRGTEIKASA